MVAHTFPTQTTKSLSSVSKSTCDRVVHNGHTYSYHLEQSAKGFAVEAGMLQEPQSAEVANIKRAEHLAMIARAKDGSVMRTFLDSAPDRMTFEMLKAIVNKILIIKCP
jgi:hypothetical protein